MLAAILLVVLGNTFAEFLNQAGVISDLADDALSSIPPIALVGLTFLMARRLRMPPHVLGMFAVALALTVLERSLRVTDDLPALAAVPVFNGAPGMGRTVRSLVQNLAYASFITAIFLAVLRFEVLLSDMESSRQLAARSSRMLRAVLDTIPVRVFWKNRDLKYLGSNALFARDAGKAVPEDLIGLSDFDLVSQEEATRYREDDLAVIDGARDKLDYEQAHYRKDGSILWQRTSKVPLRDEDGAVIGVLGMFQDISAAKWAELELRQHREHLEELIAERTAALRRSEERYARAAAAGRVGIWDYDFERREVFLSGDLKAMLGYADHEFSASLDRVLGLLHEDEREDVVGEVRRFLAGESRRLALEHRARHKDGELRWFMLTGDLERDDAGTPRRLLGVELDITARKAVEEDLRRARDAAEAAAQAKSDFLANMSHEIRTPMNGVLGMAQLLLAGELAPEQRRRAEVLVRSGEALIGVIDDILDFSKIEAGGMTIDTAPFALRPLVREVADTMAVAAANNGLDFSWHVDDALPDWILGDPARLRQILGNLVGNAVKFTPAGAVSVRVDRASAPEAGGDLLRFRVSDTGIGIDPDRIDTIFDKFSQADGSTTRRFGGTGLGLSIAQRLAELMGGRIHVESRPGAGSVFTLRLPLQSDPDAGMQPGAPAPPAQDPPRPALRVLVVEDNLVNADVARALMRPHATRLDLAQDGCEALALAASTEYDLILMDLHMPVMGGLEATVAIRSLPGHRDTPIYAMTASVLEEDRARCRTVGMNGFLAKPIQAAEIQAVVQAVARGA
jgi:PAS domain S-box-containing protein